MGKGTCAYTNSNFVQQCSADAMNAQVLIARMALAAYLRQTGGIYYLTPASARVSRVLYKYSISINPLPPE